MFKNYLRVAFRNVRRHKLYTAINILGLTVAITSSLLILLYVYDEFSYDRFHEKADRIVRVVSNAIYQAKEIEYAWAPGNITDILVSEFPGVEDATRLTGVRNIDVARGDKIYNEKHLIYADDRFFHVFTYDFIAGDPATALTEPYSLVLTESSALKYFGDVDVLGQTLVFNQNIGGWIVHKNQPFKVTGVIKDLPHSTSYPFDMILSSRSYEDFWGGGHSFILLSENSSIEEIEARLPLLLKTHSFEKYERMQKFKEFHLEPLTAIHLYSDRGVSWSSGRYKGDRRAEGTGNIQSLYLFMSIAFMIVLIACINYMTLATARSTMRAREIGVRKVLGSQRSQLIQQHLVEAVLYSLSSFVLALGLTKMLLQAFNNLTGKPMAIDYFGEWYVIPILVGLVLFVGLLAGSYPAFYLTAFNPVAVLKGDTGRGKKGGGVRRALVIFQFAASIVLVISASFVYRQLRFMQNKDLGFNKENVVLIKKVGGLGDQQEAFKEELKRLSAVNNAGYGWMVPSAGNYFQQHYYLRASDVPLDGAPVTSENKFDMKLNIVDYDFLPTLEIEMVAGRTFSPEYGADEFAFLINEAAANELGWKDPLGKQLFGKGWRKTGVDEQGNAIWDSWAQGFEVVGVVRDYHHHSLYQKIPPLVFALRYGSQYSEWNLPNLVVRIDNSDLTGTLEQMVKYLGKIYVGRFVPVCISR